MSTSPVAVDVWAPTTRTTTVISTLLNATLGDPVNNHIDDNDEESARKLLRLIFSISYFILFLFGTFGNGCVIIMIVNVMTAARKKGLNSVRVNPSSTFHVFIYILGLSVVDILVIMHLPFLIADLLYGQWLFGMAMCKLYWFGESVNKLLSSFIMTVLSWDRYLAVCSPVKSIRMRSNAVACLVLLLCSALAVVLLLPVVLNATVVHVDVHTGSLIVANQTDTFYEDESNRHHITLTKCIFEESNPTFMYYTFACGFLLPALLITYFYLNVIMRLRKSVANVRRHSVLLKQQNTNTRIRQVTKRIVTMILFYFVCWTPHWTFNLLAHFGFIVVSWSTLTLSSIFFAAHLLVCFNSAANPIMYALINRELRQQHTQALIRRRRSLSNATSAALDVLVKHSHHLVECAVPLHCSFDTASFHINRYRMRKENNSLLPSTVVMRSCSFSNPTTTTANEELLNVEPSLDQLQSKIQNSTNDDNTVTTTTTTTTITTNAPSRFSASFSRPTVHTSDISTAQSEKTNSGNCFLIPQIKIEHTDSFL